MRREFNQILYIASRHPNKNLPPRGGSLLLPGIRYPGIRQHWGGNGTQPKTLFQIAKQEKKDSLTRLPLEISWFVFALIKRRSYERPNKNSIVAVEVTKHKSRRNHRIPHSSDLKRRQHDIDG